MENANMKRLPEAVTTKFTELFAALHSATDDLKMAGAEACLNGDFSQVAWPPSMIPAASCKR